MYVIYGYSWWYTIYLFKICAKFGANTALGTIQYKHYFIKDVRGIKRSVKSVAAGGIFLGALIPESAPPNKNVRT